MNDASASVTKRTTITTMSAWELFIFRRSRSARGSARAKHRLGDAARFVLSSHLRRAGRPIAPRRVHRVASARSIQRHQHAGFVPLLISRDERAAVPVFVARAERDARQQRNRQPAPKPHRVRALLPARAVMNAHRTHRAHHTARAVTLRASTGATSMAPRKITRERFRPHLVRQRERVAVRRVRVRVRLARHPVDASRRVHRSRARVSRASHAETVRAPAAHHDSRAL